jgi:hypothetical protein
VPLEGLGRLATEALASVASSLVPFTLMMEAIRSSETSVLKRDTLLNISEDGII